MRYTLICSASGTGLSSAIQKLESRSDDKLQVQDVEKNLCQSSELWDLSAFGGVVPESRCMADVCSKLPRRAVSAYWRSSLQESLKNLESTSGESLALACHLTLFTPHRQEFFVPWRPSDFLGSAHEVSRVIVLIDDIYDMYARLAGPSGIFNEDRQVNDFNDWYHKLSSRTLLDEVPQLLRFEVRRHFLEACSSWRRAELVHAEALAASLGNVPLTVLGVKHKLDALNALLLQPDSLVVYLSHKITEARKENKKSPGSWPRFVNEVNDLPNCFRDHGITLLCPTAIDELRTASSSRRVGLTDRWPLQGHPDDLIYTLPNSFDPPEFNSLLEEFDFQAEESQDRALAVFRGFELGVFQEIPTRDHLLVSSTDGLLLYRPVVVTGKDSGGARAEVEHWLQRWTFEREKSPGPKLVAMHTFEDVTLYLDKLPHEESIELFLLVKLSLQEQGFDRETAIQIIHGENPKAQHLHRARGGTDWVQELENASGVALIKCFLSWLCNVRSSEGPPGAAFLAAEQAELLQSQPVMDLAVGVFRGIENPLQVTASSIAAYATYRGQTLTELARKLMP